MGMTRNGPERGGMAPGKGALACLALAAIAALGWAGAGLLSGGDDSAVGGDRGYVLLPGSAQGDGGPVASATPLGFGATKGRDFAARLELAPVTGPFGTGYRITDDSDPAMLDRHRLLPGDIILDIDGQPLGGTRIATLGDELGRLDAAEITFRREGRVRKRLLTFDR